MTKQTTIVVIGSLRFNLSLINTFWFFGITELTLSNSEDRVMDKQAQEGLSSVTHYSTDHE